MTVTAELLFMGEGPRLRVSAGRHGFDVAVGDSEAFKVASRMLIDQCAGFNELDIIKAAMAVTGASNG